MLCVRIIVFLCALIATAAGVCSIFFPQFTEPSSWKMYYWYSESKGPIIGGYSITRTMNSQYPCKEKRLFNTVAAALSAAGAGFGLIATMMAVGHMFVRSKCCCCVTIILVLFVAFACYVVCVALMAFQFTTDLCKNNGVLSPKLKDSYKIDAGFGLMCGAAGFFLIGMVLEFCS